MRMKFCKIIALAVLVGSMLSGCNSTEEVIDATSANARASASSSVAPVTANRTIRLAPVIGAPIEAVTPLSRRLATMAQKYGVAIVGTSEQGGDHILKGYLSAFRSGSGTTVVYVWDVLDLDGNRLNRIQGQDEVPGVLADPWANVPARTMENIATHTFESYLAWIQNKPV